MLKHDQLQGQRDVVQVHRPSEGAPKGFELEQQAPVSRKSVGVNLLFCIDKRPFPLDGKPASRFSLMQEATTNIFIELFSSELAERVLSFEEIFEYLVTSDVARCLFPTISKGF